MNIIILDDQKMMSEGLKEILNQQNDMNVVYVAVTMDELKYYVTHTSPDIVLLETHIEGMNYLSTLNELVKQYESTHFVVLTTNTADEYYLQAEYYGAKALIPKSKSVNYLITCLRQIFYLDKKLINIDRMHPVLTTREKEILNLVAQDLTNQQISEKLYVSKRTVDSQISSICRKLDVASRVGAVVEGIKRGIIEEVLMN